jgi:two-component system alkaline phosphatase synthesis response regulator PhoP
LKQKILIIEDDRPIAELLAYILSKEGYDTDIAFDGTSGLEKARTGVPSLIILDWNLPDISGIDICRRVTQAGKIPIIMLTAKNLIEDKLQGLECGADDYITKPFDVREVVARIRATLRRTDEASAVPQKPKEDASIDIDNIHIDTVAMTVTASGEPVELTPLEYSLLIYLYKNRNRVLTRDQILDSVWGYEFAGNTRTVDIHVLRLRQKLGLNSQIQTVYKVGYKFVL